MGKNHKVDLCACYLILIIRYEVVLGLDYWTANYRPHRSFRVSMENKSLDATMGRVE